MKIVKVPKGTSLFVFGDIHECESQFRKAIKEISPGPTRWVGSVGDVYHKGDGRDAAARIVDQFKTFQERGYGFFVKGNHELKEIKTYKQKNKVLTPQLYWADRQPLSIKFEFQVSGSSVLMLHGGVTPNDNWSSLDEFDVCYVRWIDKDGKHIPFKRIKENGKTRYEMTREGIVWHERYDGRFGYIVSGHNAQMDGVPKFYNFSANLDSACFETGVLTVQEFTDQGKRGKTIQIT